MHDGEDEREAVLLHCGPVGLDAVQAVQRPLELAERRRTGEQAASEAEEEREEVAVAARRLCLMGGGRQQLAGRAGRAAFDRGGDRVAEALVVQRECESHQCDRALHDDEDAEVGERPGVAEAVGVREGGGRRRPAGGDVRCGASVSNASSPERSRVSGTRWAVLMRATRFGAP